MSRLTIYDDKNPASPLWDSRDFTTIAERLGAIGVRFEQWSATVELPPDADDVSIMSVYAHEIERLKRDEGYQSVDVIRVLPDNPKRGELRQKFLSEHTHVEDEVRFFVDGAGVFYLHIDGHVYMTLCERGDLIGVPDGVPHWFDFGAVPHVAAIRLFTNADGWVAEYTGDKIADRFPKFEKQKESGMTNARKIEAIVTDIEGTTSALSFVKDILFPYAHARLAAFVDQNAQKPQIRDALDEVRKIENNPRLGNEECVAILLNWSAKDKKIKPLKSLQGMIWEEGFAENVFKGHIYEDAVLKLKEWHASGLPLYIYSSGSVQAQKLLFRHTSYGDLTSLFSGYFDTAIGAKVEMESYAKIATNLGKDASRILFLSDHLGELDAAHAAGFSTILLDRDNAANDDGRHRRLTDFTSIAITETI